ncbi:DUF4276 family protein [Desulfobacterales bacterium HSG2]|nr:DUF4276 family protein [Desulfobacterales bacterium HSG2]
MAKIGIIAEDNSDIETLIIFIRRMTEAKFKKKKYAAQGCGKLRRKCQKIAKNWLSENVTHIIICHDLDSNSKSDYRKLFKELCDKISSLPNHKKVFCIVIPIEEMEAWFLSDVDTLNTQFPGINLKEVSHPEKIASPKEFIKKRSRVNCKPRYIYTVHNPVLAKIINISEIKRKCPEFKKFHDFISEIDKKKSKKKKSKSR